MFKIEPWEIEAGKRVCDLATQTDGTYSRVGNAQENYSTYYTHIEEDEDEVAEFKGDNKENDCLFYAKHNPAYVKSLYEEIERLQEEVTDLGFEIKELQG